MAAFIAAALSAGTLRLLIAPQADVHLRLQQHLVRATHREKKDIEKDMRK
jgi:hypothetical protein